jgi:hypothetical protein
MITRRERIRRVAILCVHFARNLAFYRAGMKDGELIKINPFWKAANFNFFNQSILEWCKLFADKKGKHYWGKVVADKTKFEHGLFETIEMESEQLEKYSDELRKCRDKFIAHLDSELEDYRPFMDTAYKCIEYYYQYIIDNENEGDFIPEFPDNLNALYNDCNKLAENEYKT